jgi:hypothetical protein
MMNSLQALREGWRTILAAPLQVRCLVAPIFLLALLMLPVGRHGPNDGGGLLAPLTVDSGLLFRARPAADFFSVYDAGSRVLQLRDPYSVNEDTGREGVRAPYVATFRYLPVTVFWLAVPLNVLPPWPAWYGWVALCFALQILSYLLCLGRAPDRPIQLALIWFAWFPLIAEWHMGQFTFFMAVLLLWSFDGWFSGTRFAPGGWVIACLLKVYPVGMIPTLWFWGWRKSILLAGILLIVPTIIWRTAAPQGFDEGMINRGVGGRVIGELRYPYSGAMGIQSFNGALMWKLAGYDFRRDVPDGYPTWAALTTKGLNALTLLLYLTGATYVLIVTRNRPCWEAVAYYWLAWFFAYVDCWEHHYVLIQTLLGGLVAWRIIPTSIAVVAWASAGGPSLWYLWFKSTHMAPWAYEWLGALYFTQRPVAIILLAIVLLVRIRRLTR